ncbi:hypothetical protein [Mesorhizobium sp. SP-1A]|uniref:hypothetical protein n=1 Tax=Mesorhizobium sp. SP-1A TaxID=3077840 RepID=UPI0028F70478|nr:hypothetical protein [Mesorhizobium sp. SP-1A]
MAELTITECSVLIRVGANLQPSIGFVTFSDFKTYTWLVSSDGSINLEGHRCPFSGEISFPHQSQSQLVKEWLGKNG